MSNRGKVIKLNANENFYGCAPEVLNSINHKITNVNLYPQHSGRLEEILAEKFSVSPQNIVTGGGSVRVIDGIVQTFVEPDEEIIIFDRSFVAYQQVAKSHRRKVHLAKQNNFVCDVNNIFPLISNKTKVIFIANPNNPTGTIISNSELELLLCEISPEILVVIDEAYFEYVTDTTFPDSLSLQRKYPNVVIVRTFSKIYGLAGLRIGYAVLEESLSEKMKQNRIPFFFNLISEQAAIIALKYENFIQECKVRNYTERNYLYSSLKDSGFNVIESQANFLYLSFDDEQEKDLIFEKLLDREILICNLKIFGQDKSLRITIGNREANNKIIECLEAHNS